MLNPGDIAFTGFNSDDTDAVSFVALVDIPAGTQIQFTDNGVLANGTLRAGEGTQTFTAATTITAGTVTTLGAAGYSLATAGDQVIAFQTNAGANTFLAAIHFNAASFDSGATSPSTSALPTGLVVGETAVAFGNIDNGVYSGTLSGTRAQLLSAINNPANWTLSDTRIADVTPDNFTVAGQVIDPLINEFSASTVGTDIEYIEIFGTVNTSYASYRLLQIEGDASGTAIGTIDSVTTIGATGANGLFLANLVANTLENGTITLLLVENFTGAVGNDLDTNDDGVLDLTPWGRIVDSIAVNDGGTSDRTFGGVTLTVAFDGAAFAPGGASRIPNGTDTNTTADWVRNDFDLAGITGQTGTPVFGEALNTPGAANATVAPPNADVVINEIDSNTPGVDAAEFVELYNGGLGVTSLDGLVVVFFNGNGDEAYEAFDLDGFFTNANGFFTLGNVGVAGVDLTFAGNALQNGADAVAVYRGNATDFVDGVAPTQTNLLDAIVYGGADTGLQTALGETQSFTETDTTSLSRVPDGTGGFFARTPTPDASNQVDAPVQEVAIYTIQGAGHLSAFDGQAVITTGIVTAVDSNGFYLQDATGDGNVNTSDGIFVFTSSAPGVSVGQSVRVAGTVDEFIPGGASTGNLATTEIVAPVVTLLSSGNALPTATEIGGLTGRQVPTQFIISPDEASNFGQINLNTPGTVNTFDPAQDSIDFFESLEGMRVTVARVQAVSGTNSFGEIFGVAAQATPTEFNANGGVTLTGTNILTADFNPERLQIQLDTGILPGGTLPDVNVGDSITGVTGVVNYDFGEFQINITAPVTVTPGDAAPEVTDLIGDRDTLVVAGYNVLNLDPNDNEAANNQPDQDVAEGRFNLIAQQITVNLKLPDIIALQEVQDNNGGDFGGVTAANLTLQRLVDAIFAESGERYSFVDNPFIAAETNGGQPGGNIRTAFLYNDARVDFNGVSAVTDPVAQQTNSANPFFDSRPPLAGNFSFNGQDITVVSVHNSSRGGSTPLSGAIQQPTLGGSEAARNAQSQAINDFVDARLATNPDSHIVTIGDFNGFSFERWSNLLEGDADGGTQVMTNLTNLSTDRQDDYSFIFNGNSQALDHTFVTQNLVDDVTLDRVHVNVDFAAAGGIRASDHDPEVVAIDLGVLVALNGRNRVNDVLVGTSANETIDGLTGRDTYTGGRGNDVFVLGAARDFDIVNDFGNGADQLDVSSWGIDGFEDLSFVQRSSNVILVQDDFGHRGIISAFDGSIRAADFTADQFVFDHIA